MLPLHPLAHSSQTDTANGSLGIKTLAVIGPNAARPHFNGGGSSRVRPAYVISPLQALEKELEGKVEIRFEPGCYNETITHLFDEKIFRPAGCDDETGLLGEYFNNTELSGEPALSRVDKHFAFMWGVFTSFSPPGPGVNPYNISVRWSGGLVAPKDGVYNFNLLTDGFGRIFVDDEIIADKWDPQPKVEEKRKTTGVIGSIKLNQGASYKILVEYCQKEISESLNPRITLGLEIPLSENPIQRAVDAAAECDAAVIFAGLTPEYDTEGVDRKDMKIPDPQNELIEKVINANKNTAVFVIAGSPVEMDPWVDQAYAVVAAGLLGQEGGQAMANMLLGKVNPSGKLPETYPRRLADTSAYLNFPGENGKVLYGEGLFVGYRYYDEKKIAPLFPFGHGLSYTSFDYGPISVERPSIKNGENQTVNIEVTNTGLKAGHEVVQLYVHDPESLLRRPQKELKGFRKIYLEPGESQVVGFTLVPRDLSYYDPGKNDWTLEPGIFRVLVGSSSMDIRAELEFTVEEN